MGLLIGRGEEPTTHECGVKERTFDFLRKIKSEEKEDSSNGETESGRNQADNGEGC